ncbi:unnamed protein product [Brachionus calyciflorus]|uniref:Uncharacterized protein n=1 Tax=Brachionus calyciflorus TaxID=104777 RepID=A0A814SQN6_9BILA|nr:unnamed protein product [Brachionus calyciflorus]
MENLTDELSWELLESDLSVAELKELINSQLIKQTENIYVKYALILTDIKLNNNLENLLQMVAKSNTTWLFVRLRTYAQFHKKNPITMKYKTNITMKMCLIN